MNLPSLVISNQIISIQLLREQPFDFYDPGWGDFLKKNSQGQALQKKNRTDHKKKKKGRTRTAEEEKERKVERLKEY